MHHIYLIIINYLKLLGNRSSHSAKLMKKSRKLFVTHFENILMETLRIFQINFEATFEKRFRKYELFTEKLWQNVRLKPETYYLDMAQYLHYATKYLAQAFLDEPLHIVLMWCNAMRQDKDLGVPDFCLVASHCISSGKYNRIHLKYPY